MGFVITLPLMLTTVLRTAGLVLFWLRKGIERIARAVERKQLCWALDTTFPTLLGIWQVRRAR
jgi:hypothetical protein